MSHTRAGSGAHAHTGLPSDKIIKSNEIAQVELTLMKMIQS